MKSIEQTFTGHERHEIAAMLALRDGATGSVVVPIGNYLVAMAKRTWPRLAGFAFWKKTNRKRSRVLVSYHHPACLCWSWFVVLSAFPAAYGKGLYRWFYRYSGQWRLTIPFVIEVYWHRQHSDWMLSRNAEARLEQAALYPHSPKLNEMLQRA